MRSLDNAKDRSIREEIPLYIVQALDVPVSSYEAPKFTPEVRRELLHRASPELTKGLPSFLPLQVGMKLIMASKECVRLGIMKGCTCTLKHIVLAAEEDALHPDTFIPGEPIPLKFMPISLLLQAEDADWTLAHDDLPRNLPKGMSRRGLFQLRPTSDYLRVAVGEEYISVRRTTFSVVPADTITVYAAQGRTFNVVLADMAKPPGMTPEQHWLACYVMLSRSRGIGGLLVLRPATREELPTGPRQ